MKQTHFKPFIAFSKKEFYHILRDVRTMMILLLMPIIQLLLFGFALNNEVKNINFALLDLQKDYLSSKLISALSSNPYFTLDKIIESKKDLQDIFANNRLDMVVAFDNTTPARVQLLLDASDANRASSIYLFTQGVLLSQLVTSHQSLKPAQISITPHTTMLFNPQGKSAYSFVPGLLGMILMLICAMMTSVSIVREKELGSMETLLTSPINPLVMILGKILPYFTLSFVSLLVVLVVCVSLLDLHIVGSFGLLLALCVLYLILSLSIGLLVSNIAKTQIVAMLVSGMLFMMPIMLLSGMMFPIESMPLILQYISHIIPAKWFIIALKKIMLQGLGIAFVWSEFMILSLMLGVILLISLKTFKVRL